MQVHNSYYYFKSVITSDQCQRILDLGKNKLQELKNKGESTEATTFGKNHKQAMPDAKPQDGKTIEELQKENKSLDVNKDRYVRDSEVCWLNDQWIYDLIYPYLNKANDVAGWQFQTDYSESFQFTKYGKGQFYGWHADGNSCQLGKYKNWIPGISPVEKDGSLPRGYTVNKEMIGKVRKISMTLNLSKPGSYTGGNLKMDHGPHARNKRFHECEEIRPEGSIIFFPSFIYHQVTPVTSGEKYSLVCWTLGAPFK